MNKEANNHCKKVDELNERLADLMKEYKEAGKTKEKNGRVLRGMPEKTQRI